MRVAIYTETFLPKIDGIVRVTCLTLEHLQRRGIEAVVVAPEQGVREYAGAEVIGVPGFVNPVYPEGRITLPNPIVYNKVRRFKPDLMHSFHPVVTGLAGLFFARWMRVPAISSFHLDLANMLTFYKIGLVGAALKRITTWAFNRSAYTLAPSKLIQARMRSEGIRKVGLWRRGVDADKFHPRYRDPAMRDKLSGGHPEDKLLLYVGRLAPEKQIHQIRTVLDAVPGTRLALVGGGPAENSLRQRFQGANVMFAGYMEGEELSRAFASSDVFLFPSAFESFGLVILEAMASGLPVVSARVGAAQDMITEGKTGYTFDVNDTDAMVAGVRAILDQPGTLDTMRIAARATAESQSWTAVMDELVDCYEAILAGKPSPI